MHGGHRSSRTIRPLKLDYKFPVTLFSDQNAGNVSLFIIHYYRTTRRSNIPCVVMASISLCTQLNYAAKGISEHNHCEHCLRYF